MATTKLKTTAMRELSIYQMEHRFKLVLSQYMAYVKLCVKSGRLDVLKIAEGVAKIFCDQKFNCKFDLATNPNQAGYDLIFQGTTDIGSKLMIQVTATQTIKKVNNTLKNMELIDSKKEYKYYIFFIDYDKTKKIKEVGNIEYIFLSEVFNQNINELTETKTNNVHTIIEHFSKFNYYLTSLTGPDLYSQKLKSHIYDHLPDVIKSDILNNTTGLHSDANLIDWTFYTLGYFLYGENTLKNIVYKLKNSSSKKRICIIDPFIAYVSDSGLQPTLKLFGPHDEGKNPYISQAKYSEAVHKLRSLFIKEIYEGKIYIINPFEIESIRNQETITFSSVLD